MLLAACNNDRGHAISSRQRLHCISYDAAMCRPFTVGSCIQQLKSTLEKVAPEIFFKGANIPEDNMSGKKERLL
jgi:hypothetical protein